MFTSILQVAFGGAIGASVRYLVGLNLAFPFGTLAVNIAGSFVMGVVFAALAEKGIDRWLPFLMTGVLGGFTTFSAFSLDALRLYESGKVAAAGGYVVASVCFSIIALVVGVVIVRMLQT